MSLLKIMKTPTIAALTFILLSIFSCSSAAYADQQNFLSCLSQNSNNVSSLAYTPTNSSFSSILNFTIWNLRFATPSTPKPLVIITPTHESQIPPIILCAKKNDIEIRARSGGHDFEALSSVAKVAFVVIDMIRLVNISVDAASKTAWVDAGANLGSIYYRIALASPVLAFPGGACATVGVTGLLSGGGYGFLLRKFGMAADHVLDIRIVDVNGKILNRKSMGEDLFWALRGGGGASFGVIVAWKLQLVTIPATITSFVVHRTTEQNLTGLLHRWQYVAPKMDPDLTLLINAEMINSTQAPTGITIDASFFGIFLGGVDRLLNYTQKVFPELAMARADCTEMSWIQSIVIFNEYPATSPETLLSRVQPNKSFMKRKTDYVEKPIPLSGFEEMVKFYYEPEAILNTLSFVPYGGKMAEVSESAIPYPHRARNLYHMFHTVYWEGKDNQNAGTYIDWLDRIYNYMTQYVSKNPRGAYMNYRDIDIGVNNPDGKTSYAQASVWGKRYFGNNFDRLVKIKTKVDPTNFFRQEQTIPSLKMQPLRSYVPSYVNDFVDVL
ncbi:hypothetical protein ACS0TY_018597 [Phlomoides rotata]